MTTSPSISAYILTKNEAHNIVAAITSITFAAEIVVIDTGSTDETVALATQAGARVVSIEFPGFGPARQRAVAECQHEWIFTIDADERCTPELGQEIVALMARNPAPGAYLAPTHNFILGRHIRHGGFYPSYRLPVLFAKSALTYNNNSVHEGCNYQGPVAKLKAPRLHYPYQDLSILIRKTQLYSTLGVEKLHANQGNTTFFAAWLHASWKFIRMYIVRRGFLDGWPGYILALNAFYETFFRHAKYVASTRANNPKT